MEESEIDRRARLSITRYFASNGTAPSIRDIAEEQGIDPAETAEAFARLAADDHILLCRDSTTIWAAHPFSAVPTAYWVETDDNGWWANCAFCALGVATIAATPARIHTRLGAMSESVTLQTSEDRISHGDFRLHIPLPVRHWHDDIAYTCSHVHLYRAAEDIDAMSEARGLPRGRHVALTDAWRLARAWYAIYLDDDWAPHSASSLGRLFESCGLTGEFWSMEEADRESAID